MKLVLCSAPWKCRGSYRITVFITVIFSYVSPNGTVDFTLSFLSYPDVPSWRESKRRVHVFLKLSLQFVSCQVEFSSRWDTNLVKKNCLAYFAVNNDIVRLESFSAAVQ